MNTENIKAQMRKGVLEYCILSVLQKNDAYVNDLIEALKEGQLIVVEGTLYPMLTRLKNAKFLEYRWEESTSGPPRKYYSLTPSGEEFLQELSQTWNSLQQSVNQLTNNHKNQ